MLRKEIANQSKIDTSIVGTYLKRLIKDKFVLKISYGEYGITDEGKKQAEFLLKQYGEKPQQILGNVSETSKKSSNPSKTSIDSDDIRIILKLRDKYDSDTLETLKRLL